jgi:hypothetical protein
LLKLSRLFSCVSEFAELRCVLVGPISRAHSLPARGKLATLQDAGEYITRLPKQTHDAPRWQNAMHILIQAAEYSGPIKFARLGMLRALFPKGTPVYQSVDKEPKWRDRYTPVRDR